MLSFAFLIVGTFCEFIFPAVGQPRNHNQAEVPEIGRLNLEQAEQLSRMLQGLMTRLRAQEGGWLMVDEVDNSPLRRGVGTYADLDLDQIHQLVSAWGQIRISRVRSTIRHISQLHWLLEKLMINPGWQLSRRNNHRSLRTATDYLTHEQEHTAVTLAFTMMPTPEQLHALRQQQQMHQNAQFAQAFQGQGLLNNVPLAMHASGTQVSNPAPVIPLANAGPTSFGPDPNAADAEQEAPAEKAEAKAPAEEAEGEQISDIVNLDAGEETAPKGKAKCKAKAKAKPASPKAPPAKRAKK
eukprot:g8526.t1